MFGIVWTALYVLMGLAFAMVCSAWGARWRSAAILAFVVQLMVNLAWSPVFFGAHEITAALYVIVARSTCWSLVTVVAVLGGARGVAALLLLPYLAWILFATVLNWQFLEAQPRSRRRRGSGRGPADPALAACLRPRRRDQIAAMQSENP